MRAEASRAADPHAFIDLARLGRTGLGPALRALLRVFGYWLIASVAVILVLLAAIAWRPALGNSILEILEGRDNPSAQFALFAVLTLALLKGLRDGVVRSLGRPFLSLVAPDLRIDWRRVLRGGAIWLAASLLTLGVAGAILWRRGGGTVGLVRPDAARIGFALLSLMVIPVQAATEELVFRGWLTQALGQAVRGRVALALIVAALFAALHLFAAGALAFPYYMILSLAFSALSLGDGRLELAIGAHTAHNLLILLLGILFLDRTETPSLLAAVQSRLAWPALAIVTAEAALAWIFAFGWRRGAAK